MEAHYNPVYAYADPWCIFSLVNWVLTQHRQCVQINGSSADIIHSMATRKFWIRRFFFNECAGVLEADICQLQGRSCFSCTASQISPTCLHSRSLLNQLSLNGSRGKLKGSVCDLSHRCGADGGYQCQALSGEWLREQEMARPMARSKAAWKHHSSHISMAASLISITWICMIGVYGWTGNRGRLCVIRRYQVIDRGEDMCRLILKGRYYGKIRSVFRIQLVLWVSPTMTDIIIWRW